MSALPHGTAGLGTIFHDALLRRGSGAVTGRSVHFFRALVLALEDQWLAESGLDCRALCFNELEEGVLLVSY
jgi:hypothetical protein